METGVEWGSQSLLMEQSSPRGPLLLLQPWQQGVSSVWKAAEDGPDLQPQCACVNICQGSLLVSPTRSHLCYCWWYTSGAARIGAFCCSTHGCSCLQTIIFVCWLLCQSVLPVLQSRFQLCFAVDCFSVQPLYWHHHKTAGTGAWAGSACPYDLAFWGIACVCVSLCQNSSGHIPAELESTLHVTDKRQGVTSAYCIFCMAWPYHFSVLILCCF